MMMIIIARLLELQLSLRQLAATFILKTLLCNAIIPEAGGRGGEGERAVKFKSASASS